jgi:hypothetical protein
MQPHPHASGLELDTFGAYGTTHYRDSFISGYNSHASSFTRGTKWPASSIYELSAEFEADPKLDCY